MKPRIDYTQVSPAAFHAMLAFETFVHGCGLDPTLLELIKIRASQINRCANCINMHTMYAREAGDTEQRIYLLSAWREAPCYTRLAVGFGGFVDPAAIKAGRLAA